VRKIRGGVNYASKYGNSSCVENALTVYKHTYNAQTVYKHTYNALTVFKHTYNALTVYKHTNNKYKLNLNKPQQSTDETRCDAAASAQTAQELCQLCAFIGNR
jgi:hypothetical protein